MQSLLFLNSDYASWFKIKSLEPEHVSENFEFINLSQHKPYKNLSHLTSQLMLDFNQIWWYETNPVESFNDTNFQKYVETGNFDVLVGLIFSATFTFSAVVVKITISEVAFRQKTGSEKENCQQTCGVERAVSRQ